MGMFDEIEFQDPSLYLCVCGKDMGHAQTKDLENDLQVYKFEDVKDLLREFGFYCRDCGRFYEYKQKPAESLEDFEVTVVRRR